MAKRKRLSLPQETVSPDLETKSAFQPRARMPIAEVAGAAAGQAALEEVAREMTAAEEEGRIVKKLPLASIVGHHLSRDRMVMDAEEMEVLKASIAERGQQSPIEVVRLNGGQYGLISGMRRVEALRALGETEVLALVKRPESSQDAYQAMVEENEIRAGVSFYERANIAVVAAGQGVFPDPRAAVKALFAHAPRAKRSKIGKFVTIRNALGNALSFPTAIPEKLGLALAQALEETPGLAARITKRLTDAKPQDAAAERAVLEAALRRETSPKAETETLATGLDWTARAGRAVLSGAAVDEAFLADLREWAAARARS